MRGSLRVASKVIRAQIPCKAGEAAARCARRYVLSHGFERRSRQRGRKLREQQIGYRVRERLSYDLRERRIFHGDWNRRCGADEVVVLDGAEEEQLVFDDRSANRAAVLAEAQRGMEALGSVTRCAERIVRIFAGIWYLVEEEFVGVQLIVAAVVPAAAVESVGAGLSDQVVNGPGAASILR